MKTIWMLLAVCSEPLHIIKLICIAFQYALVSPMCSINYAHVFYLFNGTIIIQLTAIMELFGKGYRIIEVPVKILLIQATVGMKF
jgi:hypothetical protein